MLLLIVNKQIRACIQREIVKILTFLIRSLKGKIVTKLSQLR